jgi:hypothetical protein
MASSIIAYSFLGSMKAAYAYISNKICSVSSFINFNIGVFSINSISIYFTDSEVESSFSTPVEYKTLRSSNLARSTLKRDLKVSKRAKYEPGVM